LRSYINVSVDAQSKFSLDANQFKEEIHSENDKNFKAVTLSITFREVRLGSNFWTAHRM